MSSIIWFYNRGFTINARSLCLAGRAGLEPAHSRFKVERIYRSSTFLCTHMNYPRFRTLQSFSYSGFRLDLPQEAYNRLSSLVDFPGREFSELFKFGWQLQTPIASVEYVKIRHDGIVQIIDRLLVNGDTDLFFDHDVSPFLFWCARWGSNPHGYSADGF